MSGDPTKTPFDKLGIDPRSSPEDITEAMRELAEEATDPERRRLQGLWRSLTLHPEDRLQAAFFAHAHPAHALDDVSNLSPKLLTKRYRVSSTPSGPPASLDPTRPPDVADLVLLPALRPTQPATSTHRVPWPDLDPDDDLLLKL